MCFFYVTEVSNLLVVTKDRAPTPQTPMQESQLSFHRILKEEIEQVYFLFSTSLRHSSVIIIQQYDYCGGHFIDTGYNYEKLLCVLVLTRRSTLAGAPKPTSTLAH